MFSLNKYKRNVVSNVFRDLSKVVFTALIIGPFVTGGSLKLYLTGIISFLIFLIIAIIFKEQENG